MQFNSWIFPIFFAVVYAGYLGLGMGRTRAQNAWLLVASWVFYGCWDWRFLGLLALSTLIDFVLARRIEASDDERTRKRLLLVSVGTNLGILGFFKYFDFFLESTVRLVERMGFQPDVTTLGIVLPVGISFYTFQTLSYTLDVHRRRMPATDDLMSFALFVGFFPQLVAGPIERARQLLPQIQNPRRITAGAVEAGVWLIVWGYFKKTVIADQAALVANPIFAGWEGARGLEPLLGVLGFTIHIYCDFSGYSDIARGLAKLMGFEFMLNFRLPYLATGPADFWRRWHVSLSTWLRDYLYVPLGGNRGGPWRLYRNLFVTMALGGLWHGAAWPYVIWGSYHGALLVAERFVRDVRGGREDSFGLVGEWTRIVLFWPLMLIGMGIVRCESVPQFLSLWSAQSLELTPRATQGFGTLLYFTWPLVVMQLAQHFSKDLLVALRLPVVLRGLLVGLLLLAMLVFGVREPVEFFYFQF